MIRYVGVGDYLVERVKSRTEHVWKPTDIDDIIPSVLVLAFKLLLLANYRLSNTGIRTPNTGRSVCSALPNAYLLHLQVWKEPPSNPRRIRRTLAASSSVLDIAHGQPILCMHCTGVCFATFMAVLFNRRLGASQAFSLKNGLFW